MFLGCDGLSSVVDFALCNPSMCFTISVTVVMHRLVLDCHAACYLTEYLVA